jgi:hypothetical protein
MDTGIVAVSGHLSGDVLFWSIDFDKKQLIVRSSLLDNPHSSAITALRVIAGHDIGDSRASYFLRPTGVDRQDTLLVGDASGRVSLCKVTDLASCSPSELAEVALELETSDHSLVVR